MEVVVDRCAGLDVHQKTVTACVRSPGEGKKREEKVREFSAFNHGLRELRDWLKAEEVTQVAMEATGIYWRPVVRHEAPSDRVGVKGPHLRAVAAAR